MTGKPIFLFLFIYGISYDPINQEMLVCILCGPFFNCNFLSFILLIILFYIIIYIIYNLTVITIRKKYKYFIVIYNHILFL